MYKVAYCGSHTKIPTDLFRKHMGPNVRQWRVEKLVSKEKRFSSQPHCICVFLFLSRSINVGAKKWRRMKGKGLIPLCLLIWFVRYVHQFSPMFPGPEKQGQGGCFSYQLKHNPFTCILWYVCSMYVKLNGRKEGSILKRTRKRERPSSNLIMHAIISNAVFLDFLQSVCFMFPKCRAKTSKYLLDWSFLSGQS